MSLVCVLSGPLLVVQDDLQTADAIVVIGGDHKPERVRHAVELYWQGYAPAVILSAGTIVLEGDEWIPEAEVMRRLALALGLPEEVIILETESLSTLENAYYSGQICRELEVNSIILVTSAHHSRRARRIFYDVLKSEISVSVQPAPQDSYPLLWWLSPDQAYAVLYEYWNWVLYQLGSIN